MPADLLERYLADPVGMDAEVRERLGIPDERYYTISVWPVAGRVKVDNRSRVVKSIKISKSQQL